MELVKTIKDQCHECYACVRNCPAKAVRVRNGQARVINERCINCANCVDICSQGAKKITNYIDKSKKLLNSKTKVVAGLAPSFPAYNSQLRLKDWLNYLEKLGFAGVYEVAWGAQLMIKEYQRYLKKQNDLVISTACPVIVKYVEKYYPDLISNLAPIVSPMGALVKYINEIETDEIEIVLIGPCHAKKGEFEFYENVTVVTFNEINEIGEALIGEKIDDISQNLIDSDNNKDDSQDNNDNNENNKNHGKHGNNDDKNNKSAIFSNPEATARKIPLAGGLLEALDGKNDGEKFIKVEGRDKISELFDAIINDEIKPQFIDALFCEGCINGVDLSNTSYFKKESAVNHFINNKSICSNSSKFKVSYVIDYAEKINYQRKFKKDPHNLPEPTQSEIWEILHKTNKYEKEDLLNCGACGYDSCKEKAVAVYQGIAEVEMCLPYLISEKRSEIEEVQHLNQELDSVINSSYDGMVVINNEGKVKRVNEAYLKMLGVSREELLGKQVSDLEKKRIIYPSVSLLSLQERRDITLIQNTSSGKRILVTATPIIGENDKINQVIVNARDIKELDMVIDDQEQENKSQIYISSAQEENFENASGHIISQSSAMKGILKLSQKVGKTDSTVLITGESGVGKEVVARYIHEQNQKRKEFVKINCAAIPERLLESELFGYETGAFSGARREGKKGIIEKADNGTLFLDEIGEMPINMQAKLLQVIQEHKVTRIGGVESIKVNFRLLTATNRNLKAMVDNKEFREDLYYRLNVVPIDIPPLRLRKQDILPLVNYYLNQLNQKYEENKNLSAAAEELLVDYNWPGNVRELTNLLERVILTTDKNTITDELLQRFMNFDSDHNQDEIVVNNVIPLKEAVSQVEKEILELVKKEGKTTYEMANILGVNQSTIVRKINKYFN